MKVKDSIVLITGANRGLGLAMAELVARKGGVPVLSGRNTADLKKKSLQITAAGYHADYCMIDLKNSDSMGASVESVLSKYGRIDVLINNAAIVHPGWFVHQNMNDIREEFEVNILGVMALIKAVLPGMIRLCNGKIVNIASVIGQVPMPGEASYSASKAALLTFGNALREEVREHNVSILNVLPGLMNTDMSRRFDFDLVKQRPQHAAEEIVHAIEADIQQITCGMLNKIGLTIFPRLTRRVINTTSQRIIKTRIKSA